VEATGSVTGGSAVTIERALEAQRIETGRLRDVVAEKEGELVREAEVLESTCRQLDAAELAFRKNTTVYVWVAWQEGWRVHLVS